MSIYYLAFIILWSTSGYTTPPSSSKTASNDEIDHTDLLIKFVSDLHLSKSYSDVDLNVGGKQLPAHRIILALRSKHFRKLFYGDHKVTDNLVNIKAPADHFNIILEYIYTGVIKESILKGTEVFEFLRISDELGISILGSGYMMLSSTPKKNYNKRIDHTDLLINDISSLYSSDRDADSIFFSDAVLKVCGEEIPVHRFLLASYSEYFRFLFYGGLQKTYVLNLERVKKPLTLFKTLLGYIYNSRIDLRVLEDSEIFGLLKISDYLGISNLYHELENYLKKSIDIKNACSFLTATLLYENEELKDLSLNFLENNALTILRKKDFLKLSSEALQEILNRDLFYAKELEIFKAVCRWISKNQHQIDPDTTIKVLSAVRYSLMSDKEMSEVRESQLVSWDIISNAIKLRESRYSDKPQFRAQLKPNIPLDYQTQNSRVTDAIGDGTTMTTMNDPSTINYIEISLWSDYKIDDQQCYSYYVEVSMDRISWGRIIDHSNYNCQSIQRLWFQPQMVRYIRIVGTNSTAKEQFKVWDVKYKTNDYNHSVEIKNGLIVPKFNVIFDLGAFIIEGANSDKGYSLLEAYYDTNFRNAKYTYHLMRSGSIVIRLSQPYIIGSMRMLLWGGEKQAYNYTILTSLNNLEWDMAVDKSNVKTRSWQVSKFKPRLLLYIRITGSHSSTGNEFRVVYFEAPAMVDANIIESDRPESSARNQGV